EREIAIGDVGPGFAEDLAQFLGIASEEHRIEVLPVHVCVGSIQRCEIVWRARRGVFRFEVDDETDLLLRTGATRLDGRTVRAEEVMRRDRGLEHAAVSWR